MTAIDQPYEPTVRRIGTSDVLASLGDGWRDFLARPTTAIFVIVIYPLVGLLLYRFTFDQALLPLLFPIVSGFALVGPIAAAGVYEISRRREEGRRVEDGPAAFGAIDGDRLVPLLQVGFLLFVIYVAWLGVAKLVYDATLGGYVPEGIVALGETALTTPEGWALIAAGCGTGFLFALAALAVGAISLPAIMDRGIGAADAVGLSVKAFTVNTRPMLLWGFVVALALIAGMLPFFVGLVVVLPVFGHATWQLYRRIVPAF